MDEAAPSTAGLPGEAPRSPPLVLLVWRAVRLRCPACGREKIFRGWFTMPQRCPECGRKFQRDAGYFLGSIYFNYGVTGLLIVALYFSMFFADILPDQQRLVVLAMVAVLFPMWFFRYARAFWMAADEWLDPWPNEEERRSEQNFSND